MSMQVQTTVKNRKINLNAEIKIKNFKENKKQTNTKILKAARGAAVPSMYS